MVRLGGEEAGGKGDVGAKTAVPELVPHSVPQSVHTQRAVAQELGKEWLRFGDEAEVCSPVPFFARNQGAQRRRAAPDRPLGRALLHRHQQNIGGGA